MVSPPAMEARESITASWMTRFPAVFAVISSPSRMETPEETRVPRVRVNRATAAFRWRSPKIGTAQKKPVDGKLPAVGLVDLPDQEDQADDPGDHRPPVGLKEVGHPDDDPGRKRKRNPRRMRTCPGRPESRR